MLDHRLNPGLKRPFAVDNLLGRLESVLSKDS